MEALSVEECRRFLSVGPETELFALFALTLTTGMRPSEYLAAKWCMSNDPALENGLALRRHETKA